eukprot:ANDGO_05633.mRNA.1 Protein CLP1 homolog
MNRASSTSKPGASVHSIAARCELRLEVSSPVAIMLKSGEAEVFGAALTASQPVLYNQHAKLSVFSWNGAQIEIIGEPSDYELYQASETPIPQHLQLWDELIQHPSTLSKKRILICGPVDSGKSSLARMFASWTCRSGRPCIVSDLDPSLPLTGPPVCLSAVHTAVPIDTEYDADLLAPLSVFYGNPSPADNVSVYQSCVAALFRHLDEKPPANTSPWIVSAAGWVDDVGITVLRDVAVSMSADIVLVLGDDRLASRMKKDLEQHKIQVRKIAKSGGVVQRSVQSRSAARSLMFKRYFQGLPIQIGSATYLKSGFGLHPNSLVLSFDEIRIVAVGGGPRAPESCLPIGESQSLDPFRIRNIQPSEVRDSVLGVVGGPIAAAFLESREKPAGSVPKDNPLQNAFWNMPIAGLVFVQSVDVEKKLITILAPNSFPLPSKVFLSGSVKWIE